MTRHPKTPQASRKKKAQRFGWYGLGRTDFAAIVVLILAVVSIVGSLYDRPDYDESELRIIQARIDEFMILHGNTPRSSGELKAYLNAEKYRYRWYGSDGVPAEYIRIGTEYYLLQRPQTNRQTDFDQSHSVYRLPKILSNSVQQSFRESDLGFYPPALLLGVNSPNQHYHARILMDYESSRRFLIVTDNSRIDRAWVAPHEFVEEFLWTATGNQLVYSATSSARYDDGIFLWHPQSNRSENILRDSRGSQAQVVGDGSSARALSLVGISENEIFFVEHPRTHAIATPQEFFADNNVRAIQLDREKPARLEPQKSSAFQLDRLNVQIKWKSELQASQTEHAKLLRLTIKGDLTEQINKWQSYCQEQKRSVVYTYCLWYLENMYLQLAKNWQSESQEARIANAYALEFAKAISENPDAPNYLRGIAANGMNALLSGASIDVNFGRFSENND